MLSYLCIVVVIKLFDVSGGLCVQLGIRSGFGWTDGLIHVKSILLKIIC